MVKSTDASANKSRADFFFVYLAYTLRYLYLLLLIPFYGRVLGVEGYGVVLAAMSLMTIAWRFVEWGFATIGMREMATATPDRFGVLMGHHLSARLLLTVAAILGGAAAIMLSPYWRPIRWLAQLRSRWASFRRSTWVGTLSAATAPRGGKTGSARFCSEPGADFRPGAR